MGGAQKAGGAKNYSREQHVTMTTPLERHPPRYDHSANQWNQA